MDLPVDPNVIYPFQGEKDITRVKFHQPKTIQIWNRLQANETKFSLLDQFSQLKNLFDGEQSKKLVCAKIVKYGEKIVECYDCRTDQSCIICLECYENGSHEGHKVVIKKAEGGCCDCGDAEAWKPEGFCKNHTGEIKEIPINIEVVNNFVAIMQDLYYVYLRLLLTAQLNLRRILFHMLAKFVKEVNELGLQYTKLLTLSFQSSLPKDTHYVSHLLNERSLMGCMLTYNLMGDQIVEWSTIFIAMFPYYSFKKLLLSSYIEYFGQLYTRSSRSAEYGQAIACQIINSYKLMEDYVANPANHQLGYNLESFGDSLENLTYALSSDFEKINNLVGDAPLKYWRFHIPKGIDSFFLYYKNLRKKKELEAFPNKKKSKKENHNELSEFDFIIRNASFVQFEYQLLQTFAQILLNIHTDRSLLLFLIKKFYDLLLQDINKLDLHIFRPYDRLFAMTLFQFIGQDLSNLNYAKEQLITYLDTSVQEFQDILQKFKERALHSYFFFSYILSHETRGYNTSLYYYLYFYRAKNRLMASVDLIYVKMLILLSKRPLELDINEITRVRKDPECTWNLNRLSSFLEQLGLLYLTVSSEIYLSHFPQRSCRLYEKQINGYLAKYLTEEGGALDFDRLKQFSKHILIQNEEELKRHLRVICNFNKQRKLFQLKQEYRDQISIDFRDFFLRVKLTNKDNTLKKPQNTLNLIEGANNLRIFKQIWNHQNLHEFCLVLETIYEDLRKETQLKDNLIQFINLVSKWYYIMKKCQVPTQALQQLKQFITNIQIGPKIQKQLIKQYQEIVERENIEQYGSQQKLIEKKQLNRQKRLKKMEQFKKKTSQNVNKISQKYQKDFQPVQDEQSGNFCAICRKGEAASDFVYIGKLSFRNHERLLKFGDGASCLSFVSCYHIFDFDCIQKSAFSARDSELLFKCPVCRMIGNVCFVVNPSSEERSQKIIAQCIDRILQVVITLRNYESIDILDELIKSIYHYVLMGLLDYEYVAKRRKKLYKAILQMLKGNSDLSQTEKRFQQGTIKLMPNLVNQRKKNKKAKFVPKFQHNQTSHFEEQAQLDQGYEEYLSMIQQQAIQQVNQAGSNKNRGLKKRKSQNKIEKKTEPQKMSLICRYVFERVLGYLLPDKQHLQIEKVESEVKLILNDLLDSKPIEGLIQTIGSFKLETIILPKYYSQNKKLNICEFCQKLSSDLLICLICGWKGCPNCEEGGVSLHSKDRHGELSAYMRQSDAMGYIIGEGQIRKQGCLYVNEWGEQFRIKEDWKTFELNQAVYQGLKRKLLIDE